MSSKFRDNNPAFEGDDSGRRRHRRAAHDDGHTRDRIRPVRRRRRPIDPAAGRPVSDAGASRGALVGMVEWLRPGEHDRVDRLLADLRALGVAELRTGISWADWHTPEGEAWYAWLFPQLARHVRVLPCFLYTPPSLGIEAKTNS